MESGTQVIALILVGVLLFGIVVLSGLFNSPSKGSGTPGGPGASSTTTLHSNTISTTSSSTATTSIPINYCLSNASVVEGANWNFSEGTYYNWNLTGNAWGTGPINITKANNNGTYYTNPWADYATSFFATTFRKSQPIGTGNLTTTFIVDKPTLYFSIISSGDPKIYVEIILNGTPVIVQHYNTGNGYYIFNQESISLANYTCHTVQLRVVQQIGDTQKFIAVGDFYLAS